MVAGIARRQHGVVGRRQLLDAGLTAKAVDRRLESGRLHTLHRGIYAVGHSALSALAGVGKQTPQNEALVRRLVRADRLVVEVDGYVYRPTRAAFERDRLRDPDLQAHGYGILRITWRQLTRNPEALAGRPGALLALPSTPSRTTAVIRR